MNTLQTLCYSTMRLKKIVQIVEDMEKKVNDQVEKLEKQKSNYEIQIKKYLGKNPKNASQMLLGEGTIKYGWIKLCDNNHLDEILANFYGIDKERVKKNEFKIIKIKICLC